jgi:hypothetical protein
MSQTEMTKLYILLNFIIYKLIVDASNITFRFPVGAPLL